MANVMMLTRRVTVILLASLGLVTLISGILLQTMPRGPGSSYATALGLAKSLWTDIHVYAGFAVAGVAIVHAYTNYRGLLFHFGLIRPRRRTQKKAAVAAASAGKKQEG